MTKLQKLRKHLSEIDYLAVGSIQHAYRKCGQPNCACQTDESRRHGPYYVWTRKVNGKTRCKTLSEKQADTCKGWIKNTRKMEKLVEDIREESFKVLLKE